MLFYYKTERKVSILKKKYSTVVTMSYNNIVSALESKKIKTC